MLVRDYTWYGILFLGFGDNLKPSVMKEEILKQIVERTFEKLACPLQGNGVYAELQEAIMAAYDLGKSHQDMLIEFAPAGTAEYKKAS
jgi:hypothetical protein